MGTNTANAEVGTLLELLAESYNRRSWHGTNLRGSVRGMSAAEAGWRPAAAAHSSAEIVVHCAYWKYTVRRRLRGEKRGAFPLKGSNWFPQPPGFDEAAWAESVRLLENEHRLLLDTVAKLASGRLSRAIGRGGLTCLKLIRGVALHDVYHAGQIQVLKGMWKRTAK